MKSQHWYHCTQGDYGDLWTARRICPTFIGSREPKTPRLCVGASIAACFAARLFFHPVHVYQTTTQRRTLAPKDVYDSAITGERWLVPPVPMQRIMIVSREDVRGSQYWLRASLEETLHTEKAITPKERIAGYAEVVEFFAGRGVPWVTSIDRRFVKYAMQTLGVTDWRETLMNRVERLLSAEPAERQL